MTNIKSTETVIDDSQRIFELVKSDLVEVKSDASGWDILYRDKHDMRYWEFIYPQSYMHGGGPPQLRNLTSEEACNKYGIS
jgi:hypothetical protein